MKEELGKDEIKNLRSDYVGLLKFTKDELRELIDDHIKVKKGEKKWTYFHKHLPPDLEDYYKMKEQFYSEIEYYKERIKELNEKLKQLGEGK